MKISKMEAKKIIELIKENREEIHAEIMKVYKDMEDLDSSMTADIEIDAAGEVRRTGAMTQGTQTAASWNGETLAVAGVSGWNTYDLHEAGDLAEDLKNIRNDAAEILADFKKMDDTYSDLLEYLQEERPEVLAEIEELDREYLLEEEFPAEASRKIDRFIESLEYEMHAEENY